MEAQILGGVLLAVAGYLFTYLHKLRLARRQDKLRYLEKQIAEFYGPLYVSVKVSNLMFHTLGQRTVDGGRVFVDQDAPSTQDDISEWRIWMENMFMPLNRKLLTTIVEKAYLLKDKDLPQCLLDFVAHTASYEAIIERWRMGDFSESSSRFRYPQNLLAYAEQAYLELKEQQMGLIGELLG